jgi:hypothetical protein
MSGAIAQLAAYGLADAYLTGEPQITFWKLIYRRHTNFAFESVVQSFESTADFGRRTTCTISRNGDLVGPVWLEISLPDLLAYDISPTPADGNTIDVTSQGLKVDPLGNYWQTLTGSVYTYPVAFVSGGQYYASATVTSGNTTQAVVSYSSTTGLYSGSSVTGAAAAPVTGAALPTWPYLCRSGGSVPYAYAAPSHALRWTNSIGHAVLASVELEIGGQRIDKHYGEWLDIWSELTEREEKRAGAWEMIGKYADADYDAGWQRAQSRARTLYVPLRFCFNTTPGLYLPLIALGYHQIKYNFEFREYLDCVKAAVPVSQLTAKQGGGTLSMGCSLYADYVVLDTPERMRMAEIPHEYLITQLQFLGDEAVPAPGDPNGTRSRKYRLGYNHPVRELVWVYTAKSNYDRNAVTGNNWFKYGVPGDDTAEVFDQAQLVFNGGSRFAPRSAPYFRLMQPYEHHTRCPAKKVHCYSFSLLSPEDAQPSGQANFTRFDTAELQFLLNANLPVGRMKIFACSYNVLRIAGGLAGLAFTGI